MKNEILKLAKTLRDNGMASYSEKVINVYKKAQMRFPEKVENTSTSPKQNSHSGKVSGEDVAKSLGYDLSAHVPPEKIEARKFLIEYKKFSDAANKTGNPNENEYNKLVDAFNKMSPKTKAYVKQMSEQSKSFLDLLYLSDIIEEGMSQKDFSSLRTNMYEPKKGEIDAYAARLAKDLTDFYNNELEKMELPEDQLDKMFDALEKRFSSLKSNYGVNGQRSFCHALGVYNRDKAALVEMQKWFEGTGFEFGCVSFL